MKGKGWGQSKVRHPGLFVVGTPEILGDRSHLSPANVSKGRRCAKVRTQNVLLPVNISPWRCSATLRRPSSDLISRLCTAMGDVERREFVSLGGIAGNDLSRASGVTPVVHGDRTGSRSSGWLRREMRGGAMRPSRDRYAPFKGLKYASISFRRTCLSCDFIRAPSPPAAPPFAA